MGCCNGSRGHLLIWKSTEEPQWQSFCSRSPRSPFPFPSPATSVAPLNTLHDSSKWEPTSSPYTYIHTHIPIPIPIPTPILEPRLVVILIVIGMLGHKQRPGHWRVNRPPSSSELRRVESSRRQFQFHVIRKIFILISLQSTHERGLSSLCREKNNCKI